MNPKRFSRTVPFLPVTDLRETIADKRFGKNTKRCLDNSRVNTTPGMSSIGLIPMSLVERDPPKRWRTGIDRLVYALYELTEEEIEIVEATT